MIAYYKCWASTWQLSKMALDEKNASTSGKKKKVVSTPKEKKAKEKPPSKVWFNMCIH